VINNVKELVKRGALLFGVDIRKHDPLDSPHIRLARLLAAKRVDLVIDVGANVGQWAQTLRHAGYPGDIISFEPLAAAHAALTRNAGKDPRWAVAPRMALGEEIRDIEINVAGNSYSSSLLKMLPRHLAGAPESAYVGLEKVPMKTLDSLIGSVIPAKSARVFCKLDVQGYEMNVLAGAASLLSRTVGLQMEMSLTPLYDSQPLFPELFDTMMQSGFEMYGFSPAFIDPESGRMLQIDGVFFRRDAAGGNGQ
jgi:FkbM family methyltransferase